MLEGCMFPNTHTAIIYITYCWPQQSMAVTFNKQSNRWAITPNETAAERMVSCITLLSFMLVQFCSLKMENLKGWKGEMSLSPLGSVKVLKENVYVYKCVFSRMFLLKWELWHFLTFSTNIEEIIAKIIWKNVVRNIWAHSEISDFIADFGVFWAQFETVWNWGDICEITGIFFSRWTSEKLETLSLHLLSI